MSATRSETETAREVDIGRLSPESLKDLYLSEREQSQTIRSQLAVPVTIISFLIFGYVSFAQEIDISRWYEPVTLTALILSVVSVLLIFAAMVYLGRVERTFLGAGPQTIEAQLSGNNEAGFFLDAIGSVRKHNDAASRCRARAFFLLLAALASFILAISLLPLHKQPGMAVSGLALQHPYS
ncbi:MAG: hypothetical protein CMI62_06455 [Parvibaculum sp.]|uniref:hypothetical protein n=1 Tax=Parvibaculum sp. TaxID=2024848 RepID=UPI000C49A50E|nr:hypothetical protein [Parvibaculum sp.]MAU60357.1 hypothetical protein [Parvibaculum sp.]